MPDPLREDFDAAEAFRRKHLGEESTLGWSPPFPENNPNHFAFSGTGAQFVRGVALLLAAQRERYAQQLECPPRDDGKDCPCDFCSAAEIIRRNDA